MLAPSGSTLVARFGRTNLYRAPSAVGTSSSELSAMFGGGFTRGQHYSSESQMSTSLTAGSVRVQKISFARSRQCEARGGG